MGIYRTQDAGFIVEYFNENGVPLKIFMPFLFNPSTLNESEDIEYDMQQIPGRADPFVRYVGSGGKKISFDLILEEDRLLELRNARLRTNDILRDNREFNSFSSVDLPTDTFNEIKLFLPDDLSLYIEQMRKLVLPQYSNNLLTKEPPIVTLIMSDSTEKGRIINWKINKGDFNLNLKSKFAVISLEMIRFDFTAQRFFSRFPENINRLTIPFNGMTPEDFRLRGVYKYN